jgi:hypothetical protein
MSTAESSVVTFRVFGDDLVPAEISALLGCGPTSAAAKGDVRVIGNDRVKYVEPTGRWKLCSADRSPEDVASQISELLGRMTSDLAAWKLLGSRYSMDFFCGVFMGSSNDGLVLPPEILLQLTTRGIGLELDIYDCLDEARGRSAEPCSAGTLSTRQMWERREPRS